MAYFFGMYVNGISIYGRDPLLTCEYARFVLEDQRCPESLNSVAVSSALDDFASSFQDMLTNIGDNAVPSDWRNCSSKGYHP